MKHLRTLGLVAVAVMSLAASFGTASASAYPKFTAGSSGAGYTESTLVNHLFTITGSNINCSIDFMGYTGGLETESLVLSPIYSGCTAFGFSATITHEYCDYELSANGRWEIAGLAFIWDAGSGVWTEKQCSITVTVNNALAKCKVTIGRQTISGGVSYSNGGGDIILKFNGTANIASKVIESSGFCPLTVGQHTNSHYSGESTLKADNTTIAWDG